MSALEVACLEYTSLVDNQDVLPQEARQLLPNAAAVNIIWTVNARSLLNFFRQRCCNRNVDEMRYFANTLRKMLWPIWPELVQVSGPPCVTDKHCNQGFMQCKQQTFIGISNTK